MAHPRQHILRTLAIALVGMSACGQDELARLARGPSDAVVAPGSPRPSLVETLPEAAPASASNAPTAPPAPPAPPVAAFDRHHVRQSAGGYYQRELALADLFADQAAGVAGESLLCWPAALAFEVHYQSQKSGQRLSLPPALAKLADLTPAEQIRKLANFCGFERNRGTHVPDAVKCLAKLAAEQPHARSRIQVVGVDAQWQHFGLYPKSTTTTHRQVRASDIMDVLDRDQSVVMLLGFYEKDERGQWQRRTGHFASITGYEHRSAWSEEQLQLLVVNPAVDYRERRDEPGFDRIRMQAIGSTSKLPHPEMTSYVLDGPGFDFAGHVAVLESLIVFSATGG